MIDLFGDEVENIIEEKPKKKLSLFDMLSDITYGKKHLLRSGDINIKDISIFMINQGLSQDVSTIMYAVELNKIHNVPVNIQYDYLIHSIRPMKRYTKWAKKKNNNKIDLIQKYFNYSYDKALTAEKILSDEQFKEIEKELNEGG